jgi:hypothetical protein
MGEGASSVDADEAPVELEREIEHLRNDMTAVVGEIDRRREELLDWRLQLRRHRREITMVAVGIVVVVAAVGGLNGWRQRRRAAALTHAEGLRQLLARIVAGEDGAWSDASAAAKEAVTAGATNAADALSRGLARAGIG